MKLTPKQKEVIRNMREGEPFYVRFNLRSTDTYIGNIRLNKATDKAIRLSGLIELDRMDFGGITKHYYKLTDLGKTIPL